MDIKEMMKKAPKEHPFIDAELCESYYFDNTVTYVTRPAYDAYTLPTFDAETEEFSWKHYDMDDDNREEFECCTLYDLIDGFNGDIKNDSFQEIIKYYEISEEIVKRAYKDWCEIQD